MSTITTNTTRTYPYLTEDLTTKDLTAKELCKQIEKHTTISPKELALEIMTRMSRNNTSEISIGLSNSMRSEIWNPNATAYTREYVDIYSGDVHIYAAGKRKVFSRDKDYSSVREFFEKTILILNKKGYMSEITITSFISDYQQPVYKSVVDTVKKKFLFFKWEEHSSSRIELKTLGKEIYGHMPILKVKACCGKKTKG